jgi:putative heme-binding domain-containing protein
MAKVGHGRMPQIGSFELDHDGVRLIGHWIEQLGPQESAGGNGAAVIAELPESEEALQTLLATPREALRLRRALKTPAAEHPVVRVATKNDDPLVRDLFEGFLPYPLRSKRLEGSIRPETILALKGDAKRGSELFAHSTSLACRNCHKVGGDGKEVGPDLSRIGGARTRSQLVESLVDPSRRIEPLWQSHAVETTDGQIVTGLLKARADAEVVIQDAKGDMIHLAAEQVESLHPVAKSLMPDNLLTGLTAQQAADLIEFLASLR